MGLTLAWAQVPDQPYKGKQIRMVIAGGAGGGYDLYARLLSQYLSRHIPGNPTIVNQNMPGGAGLTGTNWGANVAPKDGSVIIATYHVLLLEPLFGNPAAEYFPPNLEWIGSIAKQQSICMTWYTSKIKTLDDAKANLVTVSSTGTSGATYTIPMVLNSILHTQFKVIAGYQTAEARLAVERGEVDGMCGMSWSTLKAASPDWVSGHKMNLLVQTGHSPQEDLPKVPLLLDFVQDASDKKVLSLISAPDDMGRPFFMPPGTDKALVEIVRKAF
ncbi:MAG TPA: hypothetical protein VG271_02710, partial [Beijerinckiaceae bacterium]|nr:hypothetical protein [Beijerinckiaceae bacterium]